MESVEHAALLLTKLSSIAQHVDMDIPTGISKSTRFPDDRRGKVQGNRSPVPVRDRSESIDSTHPGIVTPVAESPISTCSLMQIPVGASSQLALAPPPRLAMQNPSNLQPLQYRLRAKKYTPEESSRLSLESGHPSRSRKSNFVGETTPNSIKGVLRQKFSWKKFPELEEFLIQKRKEYFRHAFEHNYTRKQRDFNNTLTEALLRYASEEGYVFEGFTFVMLRDRIRCYYKSYLQCLREKAKKSSKSSAVVLF